jgi:CHAD domain-containing protein
LVSGGKVFVIDQARTQQLFRKLDSLLARSGGTLSAERVHDVRTTARRLESVLEVCYPAPTSRVKKIRSGLKKLRRRAGVVRDIDVQSAALRGLKIGREAERKSRLLASLAEEREAGLARLQKAMHSHAAEKLRKRLRDTAEELAEAWTPREQNGTLPPWAEFDAVGTSLRLFARVSRQMKSLTPENLHNWRTRCKRIRYVAEMAGNTAEAKRVVSGLKRMQDAIGDWHDWATLAQTAEELFHRSLDSALVSALRNVANSKFEEARTEASNARQELMREYRAMLACERSSRQSRTSRQPEKKSAVAGPQPQVKQIAMRKTAGEQRRKPASPAPVRTSVVGAA